MIEDLFDELYALRRLVLIDGEPGWDFDARHAVEKAGLRPGRGGRFSALVREG